LIRPNKIKVLVLRQRHPLKILADGTFLLPYRKKKKSNLPPNKGNNKITEQSSKGKIKTHKYINRQNLSTTVKL
jgi:hypothetical protein